MSTYAGKLKEIRSWLKHAKPEVEKIGGFVEMKDELLMEPQAPKTVTYGDTVLILARSDRETVEDVERVLETRMEKVACGIGAPESMKTFRTSAAAGDISIDGYYDPLFACEETVYIDARMDVPIEKHMEWVKKMVEGDDE